MITKKCVVTTSELFFKLFFLIFIFMNIIHFMIISSVRMRHYGCRNAVCRSRNAQNECITVMGFVVTTKNLVL